MTSGKQGVNLGTGNAPSNYLDIVTPTGSSNYAFAIANTFGGAPVAYMAASGDVFTQAVNCTTKCEYLWYNTTHNISIQTSCWFLGYVQPQIVFATQALTTAVLANMGGITLTRSRNTWETCAIK